MRTILSAMLFLFAGAASAQDVHFSKPELIDIVSPAAAEGACSQELMGCLELSPATCNGEVDKLVRGTCSKHIPEAGAGMDTVGEISKELVRCVAADIIARHKPKLVKNAKTPACQALTQ